MSSEEVVRLDGVERAFPGVLALRGVTFTLRAGEAVGYLGPNGAGKTTTLRLLTGQLPPGRGSVRLLGRDPWTERARALERAGALVGTPGLLPYMHGSDLLEHAARARGSARAQAREESRRSARRVGVEGLLERPVGSLSTGQQRRLLLALSLLGNPRLLLLDEPTLGLDPAAREEFRELLRSLRAEGLTLLISTHLLEDVERVCSRVLFLREGRLVGDEPVRTEREPTTVRLRFHTDPDEGALRSLLGGAGNALERSPDGSYRLPAPGSPEARVELLRRLIGAGLPLLEFRSEGTDLVERYLTLLGKEEA